MRHKIDFGVVNVKGCSCNQIALGVTSAFLMSVDTESYSTIELLRMIDGGEYGKEFVYTALWETVFRRWHEGIDLQPLVALLQSEKSCERERGAFYLDEADPPPEHIADVVIDLANDPVGHCRWRFVAYVTNSGLYSDIVADRLAACLLDRDLYVRAKTIFWAVVVDDYTFAHFAKAVLTGVGTKSTNFSRASSFLSLQQSERKRAERGLEIAQRLRAGEPLAQIRQTTAEEDSFCFDRLCTLHRAIERPLQRKASEKATGSDT